MMDYVSGLIERKCSLDVYETKEFQAQLIERFTKRNYEKNVKKVEMLLKKFDVPIEEYPPIVIELNKFNNINYYLQFYIRKKHPNNEVWGLDKLEDLFKDDKEYLSMLCYRLFSKRPHEAKGVFIRGELTADDFTKTNIYERREKLAEYGKSIEQMEYHMLEDYQVKPDQFGPITEPIVNNLRLPDDVSVTFIGNEGDIDLLENLEGSEYIGIDSEWRPQLCTWQKMHGIAVIQLCSEIGCAYILDINALRYSKKLDDMLIRLFTNEHSTILGFGFGSDLSQFNTYCP